MNQDEWDAESMRMEEEEIAGREEAVAAMSEELSMALKAAHRMLLALPPDIDLNRLGPIGGLWDIVDRVVNKLYEVEES